MLVQPVVIAACIAAAPAILTLVIAFWRDAHAFSRRTRQLDEAKRFAEFAKTYAEAIGARADPNITQVERDSLDKILAFASARAAVASSYDAPRPAGSKDHGVGSLLFPRWAKSRTSRLVTIVYYYTIVSIIGVAIWALTTPPDFSRPAVLRAYILFAVLGILVMVAVRLVLLFEERTARLNAQLKDYGVL